jgi:hypothetical protein
VLPIILLTALYCLAALKLLIREIDPAPFDWKDFKLFLRTGLIAVGVYALFGAVFGAIGGLIRVYRFRFGMKSRSGRVYVVLKIQAREAARNGREVS